MAREDLVDLNAFMAVAEARSFTRALLSPGFAGPGALWLAITMAFAILTHLLILHSNPAGAVMLCALSLTLAWLRRAQFVALRAQFVGIPLTEKVRMSSPTIHPGETEIDARLTRLEQKPQQQPAFRDQRRNRRPGGALLQPPCLIVQALDRRKLLCIPELRAANRRLHDRGCVIVNSRRNREGAAVFPTMREREARRIGKAAERPVHHFRDHREHADGAGADPRHRHQQQLGEVPPSLDPKTPPPPTMRTRNGRLVTASRSAYAPGVQLLARGRHPDGRTAGSDCERHGHKPNRETDAAHSAASTSIATRAVAAGSRFRHPT